MDYSKILYRLMYEMPTPDGCSTKEVPILLQAYNEHRFSDFFIYGYRDGYVDIYEKNTFNLVLKPHTFSQIIEFKQKYLLVQDKKTELWGAYDHSGNIIQKVKFHTQHEVVGYLTYYRN